MKRIGFYLGALVMGIQPAIAADTIEQLCRAAQNEPQLTWYSAQETKRNEAVIEAFKKAYPSLSARQFRGGTGQLTARYSSERTAGVVNADIVSLIDPTFIKHGFEAKWFEKFDKTALPSLARIDDRWFSDGVGIASITLLGIGFNTDRVKVPITSWKDLLRPELAGKLILGDPRAVPSYMAQFKMLRDKLGEDFLRKLGAQNPIYVPSVAPSTQQLAAGEVSVVAPNTLPVVAALKNAGAPIEFVAPQFSVGAEYATVISTNSKSANAAKCFYNFLFSDAGQAAFAGTESVTVIPDLKGVQSIPAGYISPDVGAAMASKEMILQPLGLK